MKKICCICKKFIEECEPYESDAVTHSYCPDCYNKSVKEINEFKERELRNETKKWKERKNTCTSSGLSVSGSSLFTGWSNCIIH